MSVNEGPQGPGDGSILARRSHVIRLSQNVIWRAADGHRDAGSRKHVNVGLAIADRESFFERDIKSPAHLTERPTF